MIKILSTILLLLLFAMPLYAVDTEVQDLTDITSPASSDQMYVVDDPTGTPASRRIDIDDLLGVATDLEVGGALSANTVDSSELVDGSVDLSHMSSASVDSDNIVNDTIANVDMADNSIDSAEYVDNSIDDAHIDWGTGANQVSAADIPMAVISGSTFSTIQHLQDIFHSAGWVTGGGITDDGDGTITVAAGTGLIRATNSTTAEILFFDWSEESGANVSLAGTDTSYIYAEYNSGSPQVVGTTTQSADFHTNVLLATIYREGTDLHINDADKHTVGDHANNMIRRLIGTMAYGHVSGGILSNPATVKIALTEGSFWRGLTEFSTSAVDTNASGTFSYYYKPSGAWTKVATRTDIDNAQYNNFGTGLANLSNNKYGVHWVYLEADDDDIAVVYGVGDYTLAQAEDAQAPSSVPEHLNVEGILAGKIIIREGVSALTQVESAFQTTFQGSLATDHGGLTGLGDDDHSLYLQNAEIDTFSELDAIVADEDLVGTTTTFAGGDITGNIKAAVIVDDSHSHVIGNINDFSQIIDGWAAGKDSVQWNDGGTNTYIVVTQGTDTATNGQVPTFNTGGFIDWQTPSGSGDVTKVNTPVDDEIGVWTGDGTIEGDTNFQWDGSELVVTGTVTTSIGLDGIGAVDLDYGSPDITDHTFLSDGTGTGEFVLKAGAIDGTEILDDTIDSTEYAAGSIDLEHMSSQSVDSDNIVEDTIVDADINSTAAIVISKTALTAGRSLTLSTNDVLADAELYTITKCIIIETPTDADNFIMYHVELGAQVTAAHGIVENAVSATIEFLQCDVAGDNCTQITSPIVCDVGGQADDGVIDAPDLDVDDWVRANVTATDGTPGFVTACITFTMDD